MKNIKSILKEALEQKGTKSMISSFSKDKRYKNDIILQTDFLNNNVSMSERIYCIINDIEFEQKCKYCQVKKTNFQKFSLGYSCFCSVKCMANSDETKNKKKNTCNEKYGDVHFNKTKQVIAKREKTNLDKFGVKHVLQNSDVRKKIEDTNLEKFGFITPLKNEEVKKKIKETILLNYGVDNVSKSEDIKNKKITTTLFNYGVSYPSQSSVVQKKMKETMLDRHMVEHSSFSKDVLKKRELTWMKKYGVKNPLFINNEGVSKISQELFWAIYDKLDIETQSKCYFSELNKEFDIENIKEKVRYLYDFVITNRKICVEFNGDYWHCNPKIFNESYVNSMIGKTASEIWKQDKIKNDFLIKKGYQVIIIWEDEYQKNKDDVINNLLKFINN